jgi:hypothetical protein
MSNFKSYTTQGLLATAAGMILSLGGPAAAQAQVCPPLDAPPTAATTATQDRDRMLCIQGITIPTLPPVAEDPNKPLNVFPRPTNPTALTDPRAHTVVRTLFGQYHTYDSGTAANPIPEGGAMSGYGDYGPESNPRYTDIELLEMKDGTPVLSPEDWWTKRRPEIFELVQKELYGRAWDPSLWPAITWSVDQLSTGTQIIGGVSYPYHQKRITGTISIDSYPEIRNRPSIVVTCRLPGAEPVAGTRVPAIIYFGSATTAFSHAGPLGIAGCQFAQGSLQPDSGGANLSSWLIGLINKGNWRKPEDPGALVAWAWGVSRTIDYFSTIDTEIDGDKVGVAGHSRFGKASLVAAAYDDRIVAAYPSCGGALGTSWARRAYGETLEFVASATNEYHWVNGNIMNYMGPLNPGQFWPRKVELLDVDVHSMMSLIAPRAVFTNGGTENSNGNADAWQDPRGMYLAGKISSPVWEFLGWPGQVIPPGTVFTTDPSTVYPPAGAPANHQGYRLIDESHGGTPPFNVAFIDGTVGYRRHAEGHTDGPGWPTFALFASRFLKDQRPVVTAGQAFTLPAIGTSALGRVQATDGDGEPLGDWQVTGGTGAYKFLVDRDTGAITVSDRLALDVNTRSYELSVIVGDGKLASHRQGVTIQVPADVTAPVFTTLTASRASIWPANHKMVPITLTATTADDFDPAPTSPRIVSVVSSEAPNGKGDGNTSSDWSITGPLTVDLRAERSGRGAGRVYTITVESVDRSGNVGRGTVTVTVAHNQ